MSSSILSTKIASLVASSGDESDQIASYFVQKNVRKKEILLSEGRSPGHVFFVEKGLFRTFIVSDSGEEFTTDFITENQMVAEPPNLTVKTVEALRIQAIEDGIISILYPGGMDDICQNCPSGLIFSRLLAEIQFEHLSSQYIAFKALTVAERFENFNLLCPDVIGRAPQYMIASFLGISKPSLHRLRAAFRKNPGVRSFSHNAG